MATRLRAAVVVALMVFLLAPAPTAADEAEVVLAEVYPAPAEGHHEFVELWNRGGEAQSLTGWSIEDAAGARYTFDTTWDLQPGARLVVWSGPGSQETAEGPAWRSTSVWNNGGDHASLYDGTGNLVDELSYGNVAGAQFAAPGRGLALALTEGVWQEAEPTPGHDGLGLGEGRLTVIVANAAPALSLEGPDWFEPGEVVELWLTIDDPNGRQDIARWTLTGPDGLIAEGDEGGLHRVEATAPSGSVWKLGLVARDHGRAETTVEVTLDGLGAALEVDLGPTRSLPLPPLLPGAANQTSGSWLLHNRADRPVEPVLDLADLQGPAGAIALEGRVSIGVAPLASSVPERWVPYDRPLTALGTLEGGSSWRLWFRFDELPATLPAGPYAAHFAVLS
ncbi:MAG: lamin tail domain-containing protein [Thermoplasmatota archaeon]